MFKWFKIIEKANSLTSILVNVQHSGGVVSTWVLGLVPASAWSLSFHVMSAWVLSGYSGFLPQFKDMQLLGLSLVNVNCPYV